MKVSGRDVADAILKKLQKQVEKLEVKPSLAIILAGDNPASRIYVNNKIKVAEKIGIQAKLFEFSKEEFAKTLETLRKFNEDENIHGIIIQYPVFKSWNFDDLIFQVDPKKDVDGFLPDSPFQGATAMAVWEMLTAFAFLEGFSKTQRFLKDKKIVLLGRGRTAGKPIRELLENKRLQVEVINSKTENPDEIIKKGDVIISATGVKNIINKNNLKNGSYVIGVGVGKEDGKVYGDIEEESVAKIAKLYCPTIGGIGPLTIVSLLQNVILAAKS